MRTAHARGFTLLEVMISLAILAVALVAISNLNGGSVQMHAYSRRATEATLLLRSKMLDVEDDLQKNGFSDFNDEKHGDFNEDGSPDYSWSAEILKPDVQLDATQLLNLISGGSSNGGGLGGAGAALAQGLSAPGAQPGGPTTQQPGGASSLTSGPLGGAISGQMTTFIETLKKSVREVRISVSWQDGKHRNQVEASQIIVILPEMVGAAGQAAADAAAAAAAAATQTPNGSPAPPGTGLPPSRTAGSAR